MAERSKGLKVVSESVDALGQHWDRVMAEHVAPAFVEIAQKNRVGDSAVLDASAIRNDLRQSMADMEAALAAKNEAVYVSAVSKIAASSMAMLLARR